MRVGKFRLLFIPVVIGMFTALRGIPLLPVPTWRAANLLALLQFLSQPTKISSTTRFLFTPTIALACYMFINPLATESTGYNLASAFGIGTLLCFTLLFLANAGRMDHFLIRCVRTSAYLVVTYQVAQALLFFTGKRDLLFILNDPSIILGSNAFRLVGGIFGPPSFMGESGHIAVFIGPLMMSLAMLHRLGILKTPPLGYLAMALSLILTLSGGAFLQLFFLAITLILLQRNILHRFAWMSILSICYPVLTTFLSTYMSSVMFKVEQLNSGDSSRLEGAKAFWDTFMANPYWGVGADAARSIPGDPNMLIPVMLASFGLIGFALLSTLVVGIPCILSLRSRNKLFLVPILALFTHLSLAYGTITWPFIWVNFSIAVYGLSIGIRRVHHDARTQVDNASTAETIFAGSISAMH